MLALARCGRVQAIGVLAVVQQRICRVTKPGAYVDGELLASLVQNRAVSATRTPKATSTAANPTS